MPQSLSVLLDAARIPFERGVPLAEKTTLKVGGPAGWWVDVRCAADIAHARKAAQAAEIPLLVMGKGSNLLVRDGGFDGLVLHIGDAMAEVVIEGETLCAQAGARLSQAALAAQAAGLSGMEAISGIPGTVGGAVYMNAGSYGCEMAQLVQTVEVLDSEGQLHTLSADVMAFAYRHSILMEMEHIATTVTLRLVPGDSLAIGESMRAHARKRREKQPLMLPSAGSFFKRPPEGFAGELIERAGLKGLRAGGAMVSEMHAGFLVNAGGATASDFLQLMKMIQAAVLQQCGIMLEPEVQIVGCDLSC